MKKGLILLCPLSLERNGLSSWEVLVAANPETVLVAAIGPATPEVVLVAAIGPATPEAVLVAAIGPATPDAEVLVVAIW